MKTKSVATTAGAVALAFAMWITTPGLLQSQPMYDRINVNLPYTVTVGDKTLPPGDYTIQRLPGEGGKVLLFYSDKGMKFETIALPFSALDINTARETKLVLNHVGDDYYIHKIWVQGKDYGYELPMPKSLKARRTEQMAKVAVPAETVQVSEATQETTAANREEKETEKPAETEANVVTETAQNTEQPVTQPITEPANSDNTADRAVTEDEQTPANTPAPAKMPKTAAGWLTMLLGGGALSGAGLMLRRRR